MKAGFGPLLSKLASSVLEGGLGERMYSLGLNQRRLEGAAESVWAADRLSSRETAALAYASGMSGKDTALLAFGVGSKPSDWPKFKTDRIERMACAKPTWWTEPSSRVSDLGDGVTRRLIGAMVGMDLQQMTDAEPLTVPADARYAAIAKLSLGEHWELLVGLKDMQWIGEVSGAHEQEAQKFLPLMGLDDLMDQEADDMAYHLVPTPMVPVEVAAGQFGHGVPMVIAAGNKWAQMHVHLRREGLHVTVSSLNDRWMECRGLYLEINVRSLAEVGAALLSKIPAAKDWNVVSLRFPSEMPRVESVLKARKTA